MFPRFGSILRSSLIPKLENNLLISRMTSCAEQVTSTTPVDEKGDHPEEEGIESHFVEEGSAKIQFNGPSKAFYNPAQVFNRDISICVARLLSNQRRAQADREDTEPPQKRLKYSNPKDGLTILEALSASGLRAVRYANEVNAVKNIIANDFSEGAYKLIQLNVNNNNVQHIVTPTYADANALMHGHKALDKQCDLVDIDPYGSAAHFLDAAVQCVDTNHGILAVTCTDMATLCANAPEACHAKYDSVPIRHDACHEAALRILLRSIESHANRYDRYIEPLLAVSIDFYIRVFVRIRKGALQAKDTLTKLSYYFVCNGCGYTAFQPVGKKTVTQKGGFKFKAHEGPTVESHCPHCKHAFLMGGPLWTGPLHDQQFVAELLELVKAEDEKSSLLESRLRIIGMLSLCLEELADVPLFYDVQSLFHKTKANATKLTTIRSAFLNSGYRISGSHCAPHAIKTDAPMSFIWDVFRTLAQVNERERSNSPPDVTKALMSTEPQSINFAMHPNAEPNSKSQGLLRYVQNKGKGLGPQKKAKGSISSVNAAAYVPRKEEPKSEEI